MFTKDHSEMLSGLLQKYCGSPVKIEYSDDLGLWSEKNGLKALPEHAPMRLVCSGSTWRLGILEVIPDESVEERIKALSIRWTLQSVTENMADLLDSEKKRLAYLLLKEYTATKPGLDDELVADNWIFEELRRHGFFKE